jgi:AcrR family transcriptional regulator
MPYRHTHDTALHKRTRRNKLAIAALHLFARYGYHATSVRMITKGAHTSVGTFYAYFRAKDDLVAFVFQLFAETSARVLRAAISSTNAAPAQQLHAATRDLVLLLTLNPDIARILIAQSSGLDARLEKLRRGVIANHAQFFEQLLAKYEPTPSDCSVAARCCLGSVYESVHHWLELPPDQRPTPQTLAVIIAHFILRGTSPGLAAPQPQLTCTM